MKTRMFWDVGTLCHMIIVALQCIGLVCLLREWCELRTDDVAAIQNDFCDSVALGWTGRVKTELGGSLVVHGYVICDISDPKY